MLADALSEHNVLEEKIVGKSELVKIRYLLLHMFPPLIIA